MSDVILEALQSEAEPWMQTFHGRLGLGKDAPLLGVRTPRLRALARRLWREEPATVAVFMAELPHHYHEENMLHAILIDGIGDFTETVQAIEDFLPHIGNWAVCDVLAPRKTLDKDRNVLAQAAARWTADPRTFVARYGVGVHRMHFLKDGFDPAQMAAIAALPHEAYYLRMGVAWYFAEALLYEEEEVLRYLERPGRLPEWTRQKAIQKAIESGRVSASTKVHLKACRTAEPPSSE